MGFNIRFGRVKLEFALGWLYVRVKLVSLRNDTNHTTSLSYHTFINCARERCSL